MLVVEEDEASRLVHVELTATFETFGFKARKKAAKRAEFVGMTRDGQCCTAECCTAPEPAPEPEPEPEPACEATEWSAWNTSDCDAPYASGAAVSTSLVDDIAEAFNLRSRRSQSPRKALATKSTFSYCFPSETRSQYRSRVRRNRDGSCSKMVEIKACDC